MSEQHHNDANSRITSVVESATWKIVSNFILPALLGIIGFFMVRTLDGVEKKQSEQDKTLQSLITSMQVMNTRLDAQVIRQVETNSRRLDDLDKRLQIVERVVPTP